MHALDGDCILEEEKKEQKHCNNSLGAGGKLEKGVKMRKIQ